jgi:hypothetical protein
MIAGEEATEQPRGAFLCHADSRNFNQTASSAACVAQALLPAPAYFSSFTFSHYDPECECPERASRSVPAQRTRTPCAADAEKDSDNGKEAPPTNDPEEPRVIKAKTVNRLSIPSRRNRKQGGSRRKAETNQRQDGRNRFQFGSPDPSHPTPDQHNGGREITERDQNDENHLNRRAHPDIVSLLHRHG